MRGQRHASGALPPRKTQYPLYRRLGGPQGRFGQVQKISSTLGFDLDRPAHSESPDRLSYPGLIANILFRRGYLSKNSNLFVSVLLGWLHVSATVGYPLVTKMYVLCTLTFGTGIIFLILAHPVYKMNNIRTKQVSIMKQTAFWREIAESIEHV